MKSKKAFLTAVISPIVALLVIALGVCVGSASIDLSDVFAVTVHKLFGAELSPEVAKTSVAIVWNLRLPRVLLAFFTGFSLSVGGAVTQSVLKNPLASPYTLGVSSGASLGAGLVIAFGITLPFLGSFTLPTAGLAFGIATVLLCVILASRVDKNMESTTIILCGMVLSLFINAVFTMISGLAGEKMSRIIRWQMGSFAGKGWDYVKIIAPIAIAVVIFVMLFSKELDLLSFGEETASTAGVATKKVKWLMLCASAVLTGVAVSFAGVIGFVDLIAPHIVRKLFSSSHKYVVFLSAVIGGCFMVVCDLASRTLMPPVELPVGAVTALIGAPFFAYIYFKRSGKRA